jgi:hypothetical protein
MNFGPFMKLRERSNSSKSAVKLLAAVFCVLFLSLNYFAKTLPAYRENVRAARTAVEDMIEFLDEVSEASEKFDAEYERRWLARIRGELIVTEKVEWEGNVVETDNHWLEARLQAFAETPERTPRRLILTEIGERLAAIETKIAELEGPASSDRSKDEDKRKLAEILRRPEFQKPREDQESWFERVQKSIKEWFDEKFPSPNVPRGAAQGLQSISFGLQMVLYALILGFIAFIIYRFAPFLADRFRRRETTEKGERVILGEKLAADEDAQTLFDEAEALAREGNLRGAIRKGYIALLCELSDRKLIGLAQHKTNRDYLRDVRKKDELYRNMNGLTTSFERHWYGFETADEADWNEFRQIYRQAVKNEN